MDVKLSLANVAIPGVELKRAQLLQFRGTLLAQIAGLDPMSDSMAACLTRAGGRDDRLSSEQRFGLIIAYWSTPARSILVIGHDKAAALEAFAKELKGRTSASTRRNGRFDRDRRGVR